MSVSNGPGPPAAVLGFGLDTAAGGGRWLQRQRNGAGASVQMCPTNSEAHPAPPPPTAAGARFRLPALAAKAPRRRGSSARLSLSEPSLFPHNDRVLFRGRTSVRRPALLHKRAAVSSASFVKPTSVSPNPTPLLAQDLQHPLGSSHPLYLHFSQSIRPSIKPRAARRHSNPATELRAQVSSYTEPLSVVGKTCLPLCGPRIAPTTIQGHPRPHIHVFLPSETEREDSESADEGFMDELDIKMTSLKLQQGASNCSSPAPKQETLLKTVNTGSPAVSRILVHK